MFAKSLSLPMVFSFTENRIPLLGGPVVPPVAQTATQQLLAARHAQPIPTYTKTAALGWPVIQFTNLDGTQTPGSLRQAIADASTAIAGGAAGVFIDPAPGLSGTIDLTGASIIRMNQSNVILRGERSGAGNMITVAAEGTPVRIEAANVQVRNITFMLKQSAFGNDNDGSQIQPRAGATAGNLTNAGYLNVTLLNSTDEIASAYSNNGLNDLLYLRDVVGIYFVGCIFADPVGGSGAQTFRPDGENHPKGLLFGDGSPPAFPVLRGLLARNLLLNTQDRNGRLGGGASAWLLNNYVHNMKTRTWEIGNDSSHIIYADPATGAAATTDGKYFAAQDGAAVNYYRNDAGAATFFRACPDDLWQTKASVYGNSYRSGQSTGALLSPYFGGIPAGSQIYATNNWLDGAAYDITAADITEAGFNPAIPDWHDPLSELALLFPWLDDALLVPIATLAETENTVLMTAGARYWEADRLNDLKVAEAFTGQGVLHDFGVWPDYTDRSAPVPNVQLLPLPRFAPAGTEVAIISGLADEAVIPFLTNDAGGRFVLDVTGRRLSLATTVSDLATVADEAVNISIGTDWYGQTPNVTLDQIAITVTHEPDALSIDELITLLGSSVSAFWVANDGLAQANGVAGAWTDKIGGYIMPVYATQEPGYATSGLMAAPHATFNGAQCFGSAGGGAAPAYLPTGTNYGAILQLVAQDDTSNTLRTSGGYGGTGNSAARILQKFRSAAESRFRIGRGTGGLADNNHIYSGVQVVMGEYLAGGAQMSGIFGNDDIPAAAQTFNTSATGVRHRIGASVQSAPSDHWIGGIAIHAILNAPLTAQQKVQVVRTFNAYAAGLVS